MIMLVGYSGSGKDTILKILKQHGFKGVVSHTTRPKRWYEQNGIDYFFVTDEEFNKLKEQEFFAETTKYLTYQYGGSKEQMTEDAVVVIEPIGWKQVKDIYGDKAITIFVEANTYRRIARLNERGDEPKEIIRRVLDDESRSDFQYVKNNADVVFYNNYPDYITLLDIVENRLIPWIREKMEEKKCLKSL